MKNKADNLALKFNTLEEQYSYTFDQDLNAKLDFKLPYSDKGILQFGMRYRGKNKERNNNLFEYEPIDEDAYGPTLGSVPNRDYSDPNYLAGSQ